MKAVLNMQPLERMCPICNIQLSSPTVCHQHYTGQKHVKAANSLSRTSPSEQLSSNIVRIGILGTTFLHKRSTDHGHAIVLEYSPCP